LNPSLLPLVTFMAAIAAVAGVYSIATDLFLRDRSRVSRRVDDEFRTRQRDRAKKSLLFKNLAQVVAEASAEDKVETGLRQRFEAMVEQSGLDLTPDRLLGIMAGAGLSLGAFGGVVRQSPIVAVLGALVGAVAPLMYVQRKRKARLEQLLSQLPDAFDLMSRVVRAGQTMSQALQAVADEFQPPIAAEFSYCFEQQNLGLPPEVAMRDLARRTGLLETKIFVLALLVQQQTGGNLAELLDKLAAIIRDRFRIRGVMKSLTAEGRLQAAVLLGLPPALFLMMLFLNREYARVLLDHPNLIVGTLVCEGIGAVWIRSIVNFDF
jgi:tight adherence protein B